MKPLAASQPSAAAPPPSRDDSQPECPFVGLAPLGEQHAGAFSGRDGLAGELVAQLHHRPVLLLSGPMGAGKTSLIRAGVIPVLRRQQASWLVSEISPGDRPVRAIVAALARAEQTLSTTGSAGAKTPAALAKQLRAAPEQLAALLQELAAAAERPLLLVLDDLEELLAAPDNEPRLRQKDLFWRLLAGLGGLAAAAAYPVRVVLSVRDDCLGRLLLHDVGAGRAVPVGPPSRRDLEEILRELVRPTGYRYEDPALVEELASQLAGRSAPLIRLQLAGRLLWQRRDRYERVLRRAVLRPLGGAAEALSSYADEALDALPRSCREPAHRLLLRCLSDSGTSPPLSLVRAQAGLGAGTAAVIATLADHGLLELQGSEQSRTVRLAHPALALTWRTLRRLVEQRRRDRLLLADAAAAAERWARRGRPAAELWRHESLQEALAACRRQPADVPEAAADFLAQARRRSRWRAVLPRLLWGLTLVALTLATLWAWQQKRQSEARLQQLAVRWAAAQADRTIAQRQRGSELLSGAWADFEQNRLLPARAKLRSTLEIADDVAARALWWRLRHEPLLWRSDLQAFVYSTALAPDDSVVAAGCSNRVIYLFDLPSRRPRLLRGAADQVLALAFSPDGRLLGSGGVDGTVRLWDRQSGATVEQLRGAGHDGVAKLAFSPAGGVLAAAFGNGTVRIWDRRVKPAKEHELSAASGGTAPLAFSPDGRLLATGDRKGAVRLWDVSAGQELQGFSGPAKWGINAVSFSPDGALLAAGGGETVIRIYDVAAGSTRAVLRGHEEAVSALGFSPDSRVLASGSSDRAVRLWDVTTGALLRQLPDHQQRIDDVWFSSDGGLLVVGAGETRVYDLRVRDWELRQDAGGHRGAVHGAAFSPDGSLLATGGAGGRVRLWDVKTGEQREVLRSAEAGVWSVAFSGDGKHLASAGADGTVRLHRVDKGLTEQVLAGHDGDVLDVQFSPDGQALATASADRTARILSLKTGQEQQRLWGHRGAVNALDYSPDGRQLATAGADGTVRLWDVRSGLELRVFEGHEHWVWGVRFSPDGETLASSSSDGTVRLRSRRGRQHRGIVGRHPGRVLALDVDAQTGELIGAPGSDGTARIWNLKTGAYVELLGHRDEVNRLVFSPDGTLAATTSDDSTVRLWQVATGRPLWRAVALVGQPPQLLSQRGWQTLRQPGAAEDAGAPGRRLGAALRQSASATARLAVEDRVGEPARWLLCLATYEGRLELWDSERSQRLAASSTAAEGVLELVIYAPGGCAARYADAVRVLGLDGRLSELPLTGRPVALSAADGAVVVAQDDGRIAFHEGAGAPSDSRQAGAGISAVAPVEGGLAVGFRDGSVELFAAEGSATSGRPMRRTPPSPVSSLRPGPEGTLVAGFEDGTVGLWDGRDGAPLIRGHLHGPVVHLQIQDQKLYVASELGGFLIWDLADLLGGYCGLLRQIWDQVPIAWQPGGPVATPAPRDHPCAPGR